MIAVHRMKSIAFKAMIVIAVFGMFAIFATGNTNMAEAQTQNTTSTQIGAIADRVCASAMNSTTTASSSNQTIPYASNTTTASMNSSSSTGAANTTTAGADSDGVLQSALKAQLLQSIANAKMYLQDACNAIQGDDLQGAMGYLVVVEREIYSIEGNLTSTDTASNSTEGSPSSSPQQQNQTSTNDPFAGLRDFFGG
jgi:hypothetical protein